MIKMQFIGNLACDCEQRTYNGNPYYYFRVAVNISKDAAEFITCFVSWDASKLAQYLTKGKSVFIIGYPRINTYTDKENKMQARFEVNVHELELISRKSDSENKQQQDAPF